MPDLMLSPLVADLCGITLADADRLGGITAGVEEAAAIIREHVAAWSADTGAMTVR
ncbi:hypothetical protein [Nocardiopsis sp. NPDC057823]|uniref:hypothetical protein n=1 Tax=Nocardiopsis sp. NPDC057823 TaxID=3346256 RepID=UPI00366EB652